jgi:hypothetical protein
VWVRNVGERREIDERTKWIKEGKKRRKDGENKKKHPQLDFYLPFLPVY